MYIVIFILHLKNFLSGIQCKYNNYSDKGEPIDPITYEIIPFNQLYSMNDRCYNRNTILQLLRTTKKDLFNKIDF